MKKLFLTSLIALGLAASSFASSTNTLFRFNEFSLKADTTYSVNHGANLQGKFNENVNLGAQYFPSRYFGVEAGVPLYSSAAGFSTENVSAGLLVRVPLESKHIGVAPYLGGGTSYAWNAQHFDYYGKVGLEERISNEHLSLYQEYQYQVSDLGKLDQGNGLLVFGIKWTF